MNVWRFSGEVKKQQNVSGTCIKHNTHFIGNIFESPDAIRLKNRLERNHTRFEWKRKGKREQTEKKQHPAESRGQNLILMFFLKKKTNEH